MTRKKLVADFKIFYAAHHYAYISKDIDEIASVVNVSRSRIERMIDTPDPKFVEALAFWNCYNYNKSVGDLKFAEKIWTEMTQSGKDLANLSTIEFPDKPFTFQESEDSLKVNALINSHLFCVDNLSGDEIRARLAEDGNPAPYEGQHIRGYHYFVYPNETEGLYAKVLARVNGVGDLVVGFGDEVCLVCIRYGRLTLTQQVLDDAVNVYDERLLVCL